jgi:nicotinamide riboside transporter PnuC
MKTNILCVYLLAVSILVGWFIWKAQRWHEEAQLQKSRGDTLEKMYDREFDRANLYRNMLIEVGEHV